MCHIFLRHCVIRVLNIDKCFVYCLCIFTLGVNSHCDTHPHVLRTLDNHAIHAHQIRPFKRLKPEIVNKVVSRMVDHLFQQGRQMERTLAVSDEDEGPLRDVAKWKRVVREANIKGVQ